MLLSLAIALPLQAQFLDEGTVDRFGEQGDYFGGGATGRGKIYVLPNELNPEAAEPILKHAPAGVYVSVGAERALLGALLTPNATHLVHIDLVSEVALYNQLNLILAKIAREELSDLLKLRESPHGEWLKRVNSPYLNGKEAALIRSPEYHKAYREMEAEARTRLTHSDYFLGSSYLKNPELFKRAQKMAREGRIQVLAANLMDRGTLESLARQLKTRGLSISVLDLSNAWEEKYIGPKGVDQIVSSLSEALSDSSIVMGTSVARCIVPHLCYWNFHGFTVELLRRLKRFTKSETAMTDLFLKKSKTSGGGLNTFSPLSYFGFLRQACESLL